jgi:hypothetical protein
MNKAIRIIGSAAATAALGLGASALPASAAVSASASAWNQASYQNRHDMRDYNKHDTQHGWFDSEDRWHDWADGTGWRDDGGDVVLQRDAAPPGVHGFKAGQCQGMGRVPRRLQCRRHLLPG